MIALLFSLGVVGGTVGIGVWGIRLVRTTSDLYVASRAITPWWNAAAVSGEYLSAASFLGIAGLTMTMGTSALWQPIGFTAGYLALLLFVAAPLRRYGSYTIPDFAQARLESPLMRLLAASIVLGIDVFYLVPQLKGAGITVEAVTGAPYWVGIASVGCIVALAVSLGGMRGVTYVQAFQFWVKVFAIAVPAVVLLVVVGLPGRSELFGNAVPKAPAAGLSIKVQDPVRVRFPRTAAYTIDGKAFLAHAGDVRRLPAGRLRMSAGTPVPVATSTISYTGSEWSRPVSRGGGSSGPLFVYSLLLATFLGTMGLPHILVRFYTNPDGRAARRTTVNVLGLLAIFYAFPGIYGMLGRVLAPGLYITGDTDTVVLRLPALAWPGLGGELLSGITAAGAFAAFLSTSSGLLVSLAGTLSYDVWPTKWRSDTSPRARRRRFRLSAVGVIAIPAGLSLLVRQIEIGVLVGWAFALAASTFCPLLVLGIWWRGLTARGAGVGILVGSTIATAAIAVDLVVGRQGGAVGALLAQPALVSVPAAFAGMILSSRFAGGRVLDAAPHMVALHAPEDLATSGVIPVGRSSGALV